MRQVMYNNNIELKNEIKGVEKMSKLYRVIEVAELMKVSKRTVERWIKNGDLKTVKLPGKLVRVSGENIDEMLKIGEDEEEVKKTNED